MMICRVAHRTIRSLSLYEYQSKKLLSENNLNVQRFQVVENPQQARRAGEQLSKNDEWRRKFAIVPFRFSSSENDRQ